MSSPIVSFDEQAVKDELRELVRKTIEETINAMLDEGGRPAGGRCTLRTDRREDGVPHEQRDRSPQQGDKAQDSRGRHVPRRKARFHAGGRPPEVRRRRQMRLPALSDCDPAQEVAMAIAG